MGVPLPRLLLDVDGVLALEGPASDGYREHRDVSSAGDTHRIWLNADHGRWLRSLTDRFSIVWATGWEHDAPRLLGPLLDLPSFAVLEFSDRPKFGIPLAKTADVARFVGERAVAWVDDAFDDEAADWASTRAAPTLLIRPDTGTGLLPEHVAKLKEFALGLSSSDRSDQSGSS